MCDYKCINCTGHPLPPEEKTMPDGRVLVSLKPACHPNIRYGTGNKFIPKVWEETSQEDNFHIPANVQQPLHA